MASGFDPSEAVRRRREEKAEKQRQKKLFFVSMAIGLIVVAVAGFAFYQYVQNSNSAIGLSEDQQTILAKIKEDSGDPSSVEIIRWEGPDFIKADNYHPKLTEWYVKYRDKNHFGSRDVFESLFYCSKNGVEKRHSDFVAVWKQWHEKKER